MKRPRRAVIDAGLLIDATLGWFLLERNWSWGSIRSRTRVRYLSSERDARVIVQYLQVAHLHASTYGLAELAAAAEKNLEERLRVDFYETMLRPLLSEGGAPGIREEHQRASALIAHAAEAGVLFLGLSDVAAWALARRLQVPLVTEDGRLGDLCGRSGIETWTTARLLASP